MLLILGLRGITMRRVVLFLPLLPTKSEEVTKSVVYLFLSEGEKVTFTDFNCQKKQAYLQAQWPSFDPKTGLKLININDSSVTLIRTSLLGLPAR